MKYFLAFVILTISFSSFAQKILKGKEVYIKLTEIENLINEQKFEAAINIFDSKTEIITEAKLKKKDIVKYDTIKKQLDRVKQNYLNSTKLLNKWNEKYANKNFAELFAEFDYNVNALDFNDSTYREYVKLKQKIENKQTEINRNEDLIKVWSELYKAKEYEKLLTITSVSLKETE